MSTPRALAVRLMVWQYCQPRGWDVTFAELSSEIPASKSELMSALRWTGWHRRIRPTPKARRGAWGNRAACASSEDLNSVLGGILKGVDMVLDFD